jgi:hypothetical protein
MQTDAFDFQPIQLILPFDDYSSPGLTDGWNTVLGYLFETNPEALRYMDEDAEATLRDGYWLSRRCKAEGILPIKVQAANILLRQGIFEVNSYPVDLLQERLG